MSKASGTRLRLRRLETVSPGEVGAARRNSEAWIKTMASLSEQLLILDGHHEFHHSTERHQVAAGHKTAVDPIPARVLHVTHSQGEGCKPGYCFVADAVEFDRPFDPEVEFQATVGGMAGAR